MRPPEAARLSSPRSKSIYLPRWDIRKPVPDRLDKGFMRILVVDDHPDSCDSLARCFSHFGHVVAVAGDLETGLSFLDEHQFDAIIADIVLPDGTGYALISEARRRGVDSVAIAITGYGYPRDALEPGATGFDYHLTKPLNCEQICSLVEEGVRTRQLRSDPRL